MLRYASIWLGLLVVATFLAGRVFAQPEGTPGAGQPLANTLHMTAGSALPPGPVTGLFPKFDLLAWAPNSGRIFTFSDYHQLGSWSPGIIQVGANGPRPITCRLRALTEVRNHAWATAVGPKTSTIYLGANVGKVELYNPETLLIGGELQIADQYNIDWVTVSAAETLLAVCHSGKVHIWNIVDRSRSHVFEETGQTFEAAAFSPDGSQVAAVDRDGKLALWQIASEKKLAEISGAGRFDSRHGSDLRFFRGGSRVAVVDRAVIMLWNTGKNSLIIRAPDLVAPPMEDPNAEGIDPTAEGIEVMNDCGAGFAGATALSPSDDRVASETPEGTIAIWSTETREVIETLPANPRRIDSATGTGTLELLRYSPDGKWLAGLDPRGELVLWKMP